MRIYKYKLRNTQKVNLVAENLLGIKLLKNIYVVTLERIYVDPRGMFLKFEAFSSS